MRNAGVAATQLPTKFADQVVVITGGARGIGAATARQLYDRGARVALLDRDVEGVKRAAAALGDRAIGVGADVTDADSLAKAMSAVVESFGGIDCIVANAGILGAAKTVGTANPDAFEQVIDINLLGVWRTVRAALPHVRQRNGYVLVIASIAAAIPMPTLAAYGASKAGAEGFARALRVELATTGTRVGVAYFGIIATELLDDASREPGMMGLIADLPGSLGKPLPVSRAASAIVAGIERRANHIYAPRWVAIATVLRGVLEPLDGWIARADAIRRTVAVCDEPSQAAGTSRPKAVRRA